MIKVEFTEQDLKAIEYERFNHPIPLVQRRMEVLWLKSQGLAHKDIAKIANVCDNAVTKYLRLYQNGGLDEVRKTNFYQPKSELEGHSESIEQYFRDHPVSSIPEAVAKIEETDRHSIEVRPKSENFCGTLVCGSEKQAPFPLEQTQRRKKSLKKNSEPQTGRS